MRGDIKRLQGATVLAVGDVMLDEYVWGDVGRISPEAPVPIVEVRGRTRSAGGAANVAAGVVALGGRALLGGAVGDDPPADVLRGALHDAGVEADGLIADAGRPTTTKTRVIAHAQQVVRLDHEQRTPLTGASEEALGKWVRARVEDAEAIVISDYDKGAVSQTLARAVIAAARDAGRPVVVDSKARHFSFYRGATVLTPNLLEAARAARIDVRDEGDLLEVAHRISEMCDGVALLITRGADGMTLWKGAGSQHFPAEAQAVYDVTGAGDTVVATLAVALGRGVALPEAVRLANVAAGIVVGKVGTATVTLDELGAQASRPPANP